MRQGRILKSLISDLWITDTMYKPDAWVSVDFPKLATRKSFCWRAFQTKPNVVCIAKGKSTKFPFENISFDFCETNKPPLNNFICPKLTLINSRSLLAAHYKCQSYDNKRASYLISASEDMTKHRIFQLFSKPPDRKFKPKAVQKCAPWVAEFFLPFFA